MDNNVEIIIDSAATVYVNHKKYSYGIFCFNKDGNLFLNSDWGMFGYAWRSFGKDFKEFLAQTNSEYIVSKFSINYRTTTRKKIEPHALAAITELVKQFIEVVKKDLATSK